jgi:primary-amine oxidase
MVVPYGDPRAPHSKKAAFDAGEDGFGRNANSLKLGCDCLGLIQYMDANLVNDDGSACRIANAVCIHEEDAGMAWKHTDWRTGSSEVRRARKLIVSYITTIANYDYGFYYEFYQDGRISLDVKLTGVLSTGLLSLEDEAAGERKYGIALGSGNLYAPIHQHFFNARIHPAVDGPLNTLVESNVVVEPLDAAGNDEGNAFYYESRVLASELQAQREDNSDTQRFWKVESGDTVNATGHKTAFRLVAAKTCKPMASMSSKQLGRAGFMKHTLWATAYDKEERYPAGEFPNQCNVSAGLEKWTSRDAALEKTDLVLWYNFGVTHLPRLEDFPVMPVEHTGFHLKPVGFFDASPVMDLPVSTHTGLSKDVDGRSGAGACCDKKEIVDNS